jgi:hypothetical protein
MSSEIKAQMLQLHEKNILLTEQMKTMEGKLHMAKRVRGLNQKSVFDG